MSTQVDELLKTVQWEATGQEGGGELPWATHSGVLEISGIKLRCHRLSDGQTVFDADDVEKFFGGLGQP